MPDEKKSEAAPTPKRLNPIEVAIAGVAEKRLALEKAIAAELKAGTHEHAPHVEIARLSLRKLGEAHGALNNAIDALSQFETLTKKAESEAAKFEAEKKPAETKEIKS